MLTIFY